MKIKAFNINRDDFSHLATNRSFTIFGDDEAVFSLQLRENTNGTWYNFKTKTFSSYNYYDSENRLNNQKLNGGSFSSSFQFPSNGSGNTYTIYLFTDPHFDTEIDGGMSDNPNLYTTTLTQIQRTQITVSVKMPGNDAKYNSADVTAASSTSTGSLIQSGTTSIDVDWNFRGAVTATNSFGFTLTDQPSEEDFMWRKTVTVDGTTSSSTTVVLANVDNLAVGMTAVAVTSGSLSGTPSITAIDVPTKTVTLSSAQSFSNGITLTFQANGSDQILGAIGLGFTIENFTSGLTDSSYNYYDDGGTKATESYHTVRSAPSNSTTVTVGGQVGTRGIAAGATVRAIGFTNTSANAIQTVNEDHDASNDGNIVMQINQNQSSTTLNTGTKLFIDGSSLYANVKGRINITSYPAENQTIYLDMNKILTPGADSV